MAVKESYAGKINRKLNKKLHVIDVAAGRVPADLVLKNAAYVNVFSNELCRGDIAGWFSASLRHLQNHALERHIHR